MTKQIDKGILDKCIKSWRDVYLSPPEGSDSLNMKAHKYSNILGFFTQTPPQIFAETIYNAIECGCDDKTICKIFELLGFEIKGE